MISLTYNSNAWSALKYKTGTDPDWRVWHTCTSCNKLLGPAARLTENRVPLEWVQWYCSNTASTGAYFHFCLNSYSVLAPCYKAGLHCILFHNHQRRMTKVWIRLCYQSSYLPMTELLTMASRWEDWTMISAESILMSPNEGLNCIVTGLRSTHDLVMSVVLTKWPAYEVSFPTQQEIYAQKKKKSIQERSDFFNQRILGRFCFGS